MSMKLYQSAIEAYLVRDFDKLQQILSSEQSLDQAARALMDIRLAILNQNFDEAERLFLGFDESHDFAQAQDTYQYKLMGDRFFLEGRYRYLIEDLSADLFHQASQNYLQANLSTDYVRAQLNRALSLCEEERFEDCRSLIHDLRPLAQKENLHWALETLQSRLDFLLGNYQKIIERLASLDLSTNQSREMALLELYRVEAFLNLGNTEMAEKLFRESSRSWPDSDIQQTWAYVFWRIRINRGPANAYPPPFQINQLIESFRARALAIQSLSEKGFIPENSLVDAELRAWQTKDIASQDLLSRLKFRRGSQVDALVSHLLKTDSYVSKWDLLKTLGVEAEGGEHLLHVLVSRINKKVPGLILSSGSGYRIHASRVEAQSA